MATTHLGIYHGLNEGTSYCGIYSIASAFKYEGSCSSRLGLSSGNDTIANQILVIGRAAARSVRGRHYRWSSFETRWQEVTFVLKGKSEPGNIPVPFAK